MFHSHSDSRRRSISILILLGLALGLTAGAFAGAPKRQEPTRTSPNFNVYLVKEVRHQLVLLPFYSVFDNLAFQVDGAKVTLLGQVVHPTLKDDAASAVKKIEGVEAVDNRIEILPPSPMDDHIRRAEFRAIYSFPSLQMYALRAVPPIHIIVKGGNVTLEGSVARQADKDVAGIRANSVPGVFSVTNNLQVDNGK